MAGARTGKVSGEAAPAAPGIDSAGQSVTGDRPIHQGDARPLPSDPLGEQTRHPTRGLTYTVRDMHATGDGRNTGEHVLIGKRGGIPSGEHEPGPYVKAPTDRTVPGTWDDRLPRG